MNRIDRRHFAKTLLASTAMPATAAQQAAQRTQGLPPLTIKDAKVITTSGGRRYRWVFLKLITSEPVMRPSQPVRHRMAFLNQRFF